jgi:hypothetical protein
MVARTRLCSGAHHDSALGLGFHLLGVVLDDSWVIELYALVMPTALADCNLKRLGS